MLGGVVVVGLGDLLNESKGGDNPLVGDIISVVGTIFYAGELCYEEKVLKSYDIKPIVILSYEGAFNLVISSLLLVGFYFLKVPFDMQQPNGVMEDALDGFIQLGNNPVLLIVFIGNKKTSVIDNVLIKTNFFLPFSTKVLVEHTQ